jgi:hypothetical protein
MRRQVEVLTTMKIELVDWGSWIDGINNQITHMHSRYIELVLNS